MEYPQRSSFFAHKFVRLLHKAAVAAEIGRDSFALLVVISHTEDAMRYRGPAKFWNSQLIETLGFKKWDQFAAARKTAVESGWLQYECGGKRKAGEYFVMIPDGYEFIDDSPIEESYPKNGYDHGYEVGYKEGMIEGMNRVRSGVRSGYEQGEPSIPIPFPIYSPGSEIRVPESMNTPEVIATVGKWFRHLESKDKPEKVPLPNSPQEESFWLLIAKMGAERFKAAATLSMAEGWVTLREPRINGGTPELNGKHTEWIEAQKAVKAHPDNWQKRKEILGDVVFEALKRTGSKAVLEAGSYELKNLQTLFESHLSDLRKASNGTTQSN